MNYQGICSATEGRAETPFEPTLDYNINKVLMLWVCLAEV